MYSVIYTCCTVKCGVKLDGMAWQKLKRRGARRVWWRPVAATARLGAISRPVRATRLANLALSCGFCVADAMHPTHHTPGGGEQWRMHEK